MSEDQTLDLDKLVSSRIERGVATVSLILENKKLGDEEIIRLVEMEVLAEVTHLELGENQISDKGVSVLCNSPFTKNLKVLNLKSNKITETGAQFIAQAKNLTQLESLILKFKREYVCKYYIGKANFVQCEWVGVVNLAI